MDRAAFTPPAPLPSAASIRPLISKHPNLPITRSRPRTAATVTAFFKNPWANNKDDASPTLNLVTGYTYLAHPEKNTGEDAFFIQGNSIGVFDGVSGASETRSVDPRLYSQSLASLTRDNVREMGPSSTVKAAIEASLENDQIGASTACVVGMENSGRLFGINLGDSGVRIIRDGKMIFRTKEQQHFFNCPYQLGTDSEDGLAMGQNVQQKLKQGDWLIVATDGLFDNMPDADIVREVDGAQDPMQLAEQLGNMASARSVDKSYVSPFMLAAEKARVKWQGGKADDITIVAARVVDDDTIEPAQLLSVLPELDPEA